MSIKSPVAILYASDGITPIGSDSDRLKVTDVISEIARDEIVGVDDLRAGVTATAYFMAIDMSNAGGFYKHSASSVGLVIYAATATFIKSSVDDSWNAIAGVITAIDAVSATVAWLEILSIHSEGSEATVFSKQREAFPVPVDVTVSGGSLSKIAAGHTEVGITEINTSGTLLDVAGVARTPAVGDLVTRVEKASGTGTGTLHASFWYRGVLS